MNGSPYDINVAGRLPHRKARQAILERETESLPLATSVDLGLLARLTTGLMAEDLTRVCREATMLAASEHRHNVSQSDFADGIEIVLLAGARLVLWDADDRRQVAYHEAGHALVAWVRPTIRFPMPITIFPTPSPLSHLHDLRAGDTANSHATTALAEMDLLLAGPAAERLVFDHLSPRGETDVAEASQLAQRLVQSGNGAHVARRYGPDPTPLVNERCRSLQALLSSQRWLLDWLVTFLVQEETLEEADLAVFVEGEPRIRTLAYFAAQTSN